MNTCIQCQQFSFKEAGGMAVHGCGWCPTINRVYDDGSISRAATIGGDRPACDKFEAVPIEQVVQRRAWLAKKRGTA